MTQIIEQLNNLNAQVFQLCQQGDLKQAVIVAKQAIMLAQSTKNTEHPVYCDSINNLAELYRMQGRYSEAEPLYQQALKTRKRLFGEEHIDVAQSLNNLAALYVSQGYYSQAEQYFFLSLNLWKRLLGDEHSQVLTVLNNIAEVYREQGRYQDAENLYLQIIKIQKKNPNEYEAHEIWRTLNNLAALYESQGRYQDAENKYLEAIDKIKRLQDSEHHDVAVSLNNLAVLYDSQGRYSQAEEKFLQALAICKKLLGDDHPYIASTLNNIAANYKEQGRYLEAEKKYIEALTMRKSVFGDEHPEVATSLSNLAEIYLLQGRYPEAEENYRAAFSMRQRLFPSEHPDIAENLNNLAVLYLHQGRYTQAEQLHLDALSMCDRLLGKQNPDYADYLNNLGKLYQDQGRYSEAEQKYLEVLEVRKSVVGEEHPSIAESFNDLAAVYRLQGRYVQSEQMHLAALAMRKKLLGEKHPDVATSLNNLAVLYDTQFKYSQAESLFLEALAIVKEVFGDRHPQVASSLSNLAAIYTLQRRYLEAEKIHLEVLRIRKSLLGEEHPDVARSLNSLAEIDLSLGRYFEAERKYSEALELRKRLLGEEHPDVGQSLNTLATILTASDRPEDALSYRVQASYINDKLISRVFAFSSDSDRFALIEKLRGNFDLFLSLIYQHLLDSDSAKQQALDFVLKRKALTAASLAAQNQAMYSDRYPHLQDKFRQLGELNAQLVTLTFSASRISDFTAYQQQLAQLETQHNNLQKQLASQVPEIQLAEQLPNRFAVAEALPTHSILIEFVRFDVFDFHAVRAKGDKQWHAPRYLAFILPSDQPDAVQAIDLGDVEPIDNLIQEFHSQTSKPTTKALAWSKKPSLPQSQTTPYVSKAAIQLSQTLFQPILKGIRGYKRLIIAPDGNINLVPFQILPLDETGTHLLMDEYTISYLGVGRDILRSRVQTTRAANISLIIADPDFDLASEPTSIMSSSGDNLEKKSQNTQVETAIAQKQSSNEEFIKTSLVTGHWSLVTGQKQPSNEEFINTLDGNLLSRAHGTRFLGESVAKKLKSVKLYAGTEALETHLTTHECPNIMLIATHGLFLPDSQQEPPKVKEEEFEHFALSTVKNPMMRSGLALAGANTWLSGGTLPPQAGKGFLLAQDIASLDLWGNELTVLSACDTGRGDIKIGEGVFGLRRAFAVAGAKTLVMSLWKVPDRATALLMERFFDNLHSGMEYAEALQNAQNYTRKITVKELRQSTLGTEILKELLFVTELSAHSQIHRSEDDTPLRHPVYWGAWICQGA
ncbi:tetratricopeptide repeat protein [Scytonema sp. UIC 10036]|uniref:tetratricopeptide repeat protein n=1 Tax=Scytonema sp. UIC 10036 TaxID=2304196 RepID=UPI0012DA4D4B|nr:tetratricopeptide repeat protein [Scytonema sp. UIC 10036]MUH01065.1 tetratricopeptide repeat protein [Scytonema sp. UIC 10036]